MLSAVSSTVAHTYTGTGNSGSAEEHCTLQRLVFIVPLAPNAGAHLLPEAGATQERRLEAVRCSAWLGCVGGHEACVLPANPLATGPWLVSPHRLARRWLGGPAPMPPEATAGSPRPLRWLMIGCHGWE